jgi:quinol monooxygenase YgiN
MVEVEVHQGFAVGNLAARMRPSPPWDSRVPRGQAAVAGHRHLVQPGCDLDGAADHRGIHGVVVGIHPDVIVTRQPGAQPPAGHRGHRRQPEHRRLIGVPPVCRPAPRRGVAPVLGSPYEDRLLSARGEQAWPGAGAGDVVVIMQVEIQPPRLDEALSLAEEVAAAQSADAAMSGQVLLQRRYRTSNLELISVWSSPEALEEHLASGSAQAPGSALEPRLVAPIDVRRHRLFAGGWTTP